VHYFRENNFIFFVGLDIKIAVFLLVVSDGHHEADASITRLCHRHWFDNLSEKLGNGNFGLLSPFTRKNYTGQ
jgi:hypothetical protein